MYVGCLSTQTLFPRLTIPIKLKIHSMPNLFRFRGENFRGKVG